MKFAKRIAGAVAFGMGMLIGSGLSAQAGYVVTFEQQGPNVVANGRGSINLTGLTAPIFIEDTAFCAGVVPFRGEEITGPACPTFGLFSFYTGASGPSSFGPGTGADPDSGSGDLVEEGVFVGGALPAVIGVPVNYQSGAQLVDSSTYLNASFDTLGLTPGTYVYTWSSDSFTVQIGPAVPEPASLALLGSGLLGLLVAGRARKPR